MSRCYMITLLRNVQTRSGAHPTSYSMGTAVPAPRDKAAGPWI